MRKPPSAHARRGGSNDRRLFHSPAPPSAKDSGPFRTCEKSEKKQREAWVSKWTLDNLSHHAEVTLSSYVIGIM
jgi:hypothetical protein